MGRARKKRAPKVAASVLVVNQHSHPEWEVNAGVEADAEDAAVAATHLFIVVGEVRAQHTEAQVGAEDVAELRRVSPAAYVRVPNPRREVRLNAESGGRQRDADVDRAYDARRRRAVGGRIRVRRTDLQVDRDREQRAADQSEVRTATEAGDALGRQIGLPRRHARREREGTETEGGPAAPRVALAVVGIRVRVIAADREPGAALGAVPHRLAEPL